MVIYLAKSVHTRAKSEIMASICLITRDSISCCNLFRKKYLRGRSRAKSVHARAKSVHARDSISCCNLFRKKYLRGRSHANDILRVRSRAKSVHMRAKSEIMASICLIARDSIPRGDLSCGKYLCARNRAKKCSYARDSIPCGDLSEKKVIECARLFIFCY